MDNIIDYRDFIDIAKINLTQKINSKIDEYNKKKSLELKREIIDLMNDRREIYLFNIDTIKKYV